MAKDLKDPANYKSYEENSYETVEIKSSTGGQIGAKDRLAYTDDNSTQVSTDNMADSNAKNRTHIVELRPADASTNDPQFFSGDPIIEARQRTNAEQQAKLVRILKSSMPSGPMNKSAGEAPLREMDQEQ